MKQDYKDWLEEQKYAPGTITAQLHRVGRVEDLYGSLDDHVRDGTFQDVVAELSYSTEDARRNRPNPSKIIVEGSIRNNLQSYKSAVLRYQRFLIGSDRTFPEATDEVIVATGELAEAAAYVSQKLSLERDMQAALRRNITSLKPTLSIIDDGAERSVFSGFIDITCVDSEDDTLVVIELKAGKADSRAIGQILGYMGDLAEDEDRPVRGILVANEFDKRTRSAAKVVPTLTLMRYSIEFRFTQET
jgi:hypothetical protein